MRWNQIENSLNHMKSPILKYWLKTGWHDIQAVHKTVKYEKWLLKTENFSITAADDHIVFKENFSPVFIKDLNLGEQIITEKGLETVIEIKSLEESDNMYDISVDSDRHSYFTNGILSHNSTSYCIFALHYIITNKDKNILICANRFNTAKDILSRIQMAYEELPGWLKPGIKEYNKASIVFDNRM